MTFHKTALEFNQLVSQQKFIEALKFYDNNIVSTDNLNSPVIGIASLETKTKDFIENATIETIEIVSLLSENNLSATNWYYAYEHKSLGKFSGHRFSVQRWKNNKIIQENHFYNE
ncbi:MAG: hypothetical protein C0459_06445 [Chitinophaga sp.]|jgi:hypothetical protein|nr:hypothetical protein [Chitinophaga sp.]